MAIGSKCSVSGLFGRLEDIEIAYLEEFDECCTLACETWRVAEMKDFLERTRHLLEDAVLGPVRMEGDDGK